MIFNILKNSINKIEPACCRRFSVKTQTENAITIGNKKFLVDDFTNVTPKILSLVGTNLHTTPNHPLCLIRKRIVNYFYKRYVNPKGNPLFSVYDDLNPIVTVQQNFDNLLIPKNHPSRAKSDCYYINRNELLRAHTTAHQVDLLRSGLNNFLVCGEVFRRDEIDSTHYPVFHQIDGLRLINKDKLFRGDRLEIFEKQKVNNGCDDSKFLKQDCHTLEAVKLTESELKSTLSDLSKSLFGEKIKTRWTDTQFPFTYPSWELEIFYNNKWLEVLGCGIVRNEIIQKAGIIEDTIGYAFGIGLERLAMILYNIPDIRLFWSKDSGFLSQFNDINLYKNIKYKPVSVYPQCINDLSFWLPNDMSIDNFVLNDFYDVVRDVAGSTLEQVKQIDSFVHPKTGRSSLCFRLIYRDMERTLTQAEVNEIHKQISDKVVEYFGVTMR